MKQVVNPYNFIPFSRQAPDRTSPEKTYQDTAALLHGYLEIQMTNTTDLIIPESEPYQKDARGHSSYHFFRLPDAGRTPAIPGSEIRGLLRNVYETITNSCTTVLLDHNDYSMRTPTSGAFKKKGLLEYDAQKQVWRLYASADNAIRLDESSYKQDLRPTGRYQGVYRDGQQVYFSGSDIHVTLRNKPEGAGVRKGWLLFNKPVQEPRSFGKTKHYRINIVEKSSNVPLAIWQDDEPYTMLDEILDPKKTPKNTRRLPSHDDYWAALKNVHQNGGCIPVWFLEIVRGKDKLYYLSNASIGRVHMNRTWKDVMGVHSPCEKYDALCPACRLFGSVQDGGFKSRIRVTDALYADGTPKPEDFGSRTLDILSTPRPSAYEFYIRKPNDKDVRFWNYDYYGTHSKNGLIYKDTPEAGPRGRKFYWHGPVKQTNAIRSNQNSTMEFLKKGHHFRFRIYFDGITEKQLSELEYVITLGENRENSPLQLKIGHGKPLGYGSVKLTIRSLCFRKVKREGENISYTAEAQNVPEVFDPPANVDKVAMTSLLVMCNENSTKGKTVAYPTWTNNRGDNVAIFEWFSYNRRSNNPPRQFGGNWSTLPEPTEKKITIDSQ